MKSLYVAIAVLITMGAPGATSAAPPSAGLRLGAPHTGLVEAIHHKPGHTGGRGRHLGWYKKNRGKHKGWRR